VKPWYVPSSSPSWPIIALWPRPHARRVSRIAQIDVPSAGHSNPAASMLALDTLSRDQRARADESHIPRCVPRASP
jgi:hypothetical protein